MFVTSPSWSIPGKSTRTKNDNTPSPFGYHPEKWQTMHSPSWKIGTCKRNKQNNNPVPGPGQYETVKANNCTKLGKFGNENHRNEKYQKTPSPDAYSPNFKYGRPASPSLTISSKPRQNKIDTIPGPGSYESKYNTKPCKSGIKIGEEKRFITLKVEGPSPQAYNPSKNNFKKVSVGFTKQNLNYNSTFEKQQAKLPGPGSYDSNSLFERNMKQRKGYIISSKHKETVEDSIPGPGQYDPVFVSLPQSPKVTMKGCHRSIRIQNTPGPSQYHKQGIFDSKRNGYSIGKGQRILTDFCKNNPGPGAYDPKKIVSQTPKFSLYGSRIDDQKSFSPGPGAYNPDKNLIKKRPQSAKIGNSKRGEPEKENVPGPGSYEIKNRPSTPQSFTKQDRNKLTQPRSPGPGDYNVQPLIGQAPSYCKKK